MLLIDFMPCEMLVCNLRSYILTRPNAFEVLFIKLFEMINNHLISSQGFKRDAVTRHVR